MFKKELSATGINGTIKGELIATMNYGKKHITGTHAGTHDDYEKDIPIHKVEAFVNGILWSKVDEITSENMLLNDSKDLHDKLVDRLFSLASEEPVKTFVDKMNEIFK